MSGSFNVSSFYKHGNNTDLVLNGDAAKCGGIKECSNSVLIRSGSLLPLKICDWHVWFLRCVCRPCILIFDSLMGPSRTSTIRILKEWVFFLLSCRDVSWISLNISKFSILLSAKHFFFLGEVEKKRKKRGGFWKFAVAEPSPQQKRRKKFQVGSDL